MDSFSKEQRQDVLLLAKKIDLPIQVLNEIENVLKTNLMSGCEKAEEKLVNPLIAPEFYKELEEIFLAQGYDSIAVLTVYLKAAFLTNEIYKQNFVSEKIFIDTMKCFSRFLNEAMQREGKYVFNRAFWAWRHLSCTLFRLGALEFEYRVISDAEPLPPGLKVGSPILSVHIPSDATLNDEELKASYKLAKTFFTEYSQAFCIKGKPEAVICGTWLLSKPLRKCLKQTSGILKFAKDYTIYYKNDDDESFYQWLFNNKKPPMKLPLQTSLQRSVALHIKQGGKIGMYYGIKSL